MKSASNRLFELRDLYRIAVWVASKPFYWLAPPTLFFRLAAVRGALDTWFLPLRREIRSTIELHLGKGRTAKETSLIVRRHLQACRKLRFIRVWPQIRGFAGADAITVEGLHHLDQALTLNKGVILLSGHFGHTRVLKPILRSRGRQVLLVAPPAERSGPQRFPPYFTRLGAFVHDRMLGLPRASSADPRWTETVGTDIAAGLNLRGQIAALARNDILVVLAEGQAGYGFRHVSILGTDVPLATGPFRLARQTGASALPAFVVDEPGRQGPAGLRLIIRPPLEIDLSDDAEADSNLALERFADIYREVAEAYPHDWNWAWVWDGRLVPYADIGALTNKAVRARVRAALAASEVGDRTA